MSLHTQPEKQLRIELVSPALGFSESLSLSRSQAEGILFPRLGMELLVK